MSNLHFGHFSAIPEYRQVNRALIAQLLDRLPNPFVHLDVATGAGLVPQLIIEEATARGYRGRVIALDRDENALEIASAAVQGNENVSVTFVHGDARDVARVSGGAPAARGRGFRQHSRRHPRD